MIGTKFVVGLKPTPQGLRMAASLPIFDSPGVETHLAFLRNGLRARAKAPKSHLSIFALLPL